MKALKSLIQDDNRKAEKETDRRLIAKINAGESLTSDELTYCALNWSPITQARYLVKYSAALKRAREASREIHTT